MRSVSRLGEADTPAHDPHCTNINETINACDVSFKKSVLEGSQV